MSLVQSFASAEQISPQTWKPWGQYSEAEKDSLRNRWTRVKVNEVVKALREAKSVPVDRLALKEEYAEVYRDTAAEKSYDLRGIPLGGVDLTGSDLRFTHLEGALLDSANLWGANLQDARVNAANLQGTSLRRANLQGAYLWEANLQNADLSQANLQNADLWRANLQGAQLVEANLQHANFWSANLQNACLRRANLRAANFWSANLQGADFFLARLDSTHLAFANLGEAKSIRYIVWTDSVLPRYFIAEETKMDSSMWDSRIAEDTYRDLKSFYREAGLPEIAAEFHFRENEVRTKRYDWYRPQRILRLLFLKWTYGYGSRPIWLLWYSAVVIGLFATVFTLLTLPRATSLGICLVESDAGNKKETPLAFRKGLLFWDCLYFSILSFATFGYGALQPRQWLEFFRLKPVEYKPLGWARIFVGIEAALGIYLLALLATVLFGSR
jgi:uncharacterized protein YjbI with pentapeptide repeats